MSVPRRVASKTLAALALLLLPGSAVAQVSAEERLCLSDYLRARQDVERGLEVLRGCAERFPDSYQIQRTLGLRLAEVADERDGDATLSADAAAHLGRAAAIDSDRFSDDWVLLAGLEARLGRTEAALQAYERAAGFVTPTQRTEVEDTLWRLYRDAGRDDDALSLWADIWHRHSDDFDSQLAAGRLLRDADRVAEAKDCFARAVELRPDDAAARQEHLNVLMQVAADGTSADKKALLDALLPTIAEVDDAMLATLLRLAGEVLRPDAAERISDEMLRRDPDSALPNLVRAERLEAAGSTDDALSAARQALASDLPDGQAARAHAVIGRIEADRAYAAYTRAGDSTSKELVDQTAARYRRALRHLREAAAGGEDVDAEIQSAERALAALGGASADYRERRAQAEREACERLGPQARLAYDRDRAMTRTVRSAVSLSPAAGDAAGPGRLAAGVTVALRDAAVVGSSCWYHVKAADGTSGWARASAFSE